MPLVSTDVGSCSELVEGAGEQDRALGSAGAIVPINDPQALAMACRTLLLDQAAWDQASQAGINRVERFYTQQQMFSRYRELYQEALS